MKNIVLTGFMCCGKTTVGKELSKKTGYKFIDSDEYIERKYKKTIPEIFKTLGEERFREMEKECIKEISLMSSCVISTGGGVVLNPENVENLRKNGVVCYLEIGCDTVIKRRGDEGARPLLDNLTREEISKKLELRKPFYENNDFKIVADELSPMQVCDMVLESYKLFV